MVSHEMIGIVGPAIAAGLMIALTHAPLGLEVLRRGIIFIDLAVAQIAGLGLLAAQLFMHEPPWWAAQGIALSAALLAGVFFRRIEQSLPEQQEAIIGCTYVLAASLAMLFLSNHPHGGEEIQHLLSGQILFVTWGDVLAHAPVYAAILLFWFLRPALRQSVWFYLFFATAITSSVQLVGVYVVFSTLVMPALAAAKSRTPHRMAWACGLAAVLLGIGLSVWSDAPAGPLIVVTCAGILGLVTLRDLCRKT